MSDNLKQKEDFDFEMEFCLKKPRVFLTEAITLKYIADVTLEFENAKSRGNINVEQGIFSDDIILRGYFPYRTIRMLMAYSIENLTKYIVIQKYKLDNPSATKLPINKIKTHNLIALFNSIGYNFPEDYTVYISSWNKCSVWAGRYPLPVSAYQMYESRKVINGMGSMKFAFRSSKGLMESDVIHSNISDHEYEAYIRIFSDLRKSKCDIK